MCVPTVFVPLPGTTKADVTVSLATSSALTSSAPPAETPQQAVSQMVNSLTKISMAFLSAKMVRRAAKEPPPSTDRTLAEEPPLESVEKAQQLLDNLALFYFNIDSRVPSDLIGPYWKTPASSRTCFPTPTYTLLPPFPEPII